MYTDPPARTWRQPTTLNVVVVAALVLISPSAGTGDGLKTSSRPQPAAIDVRSFKASGRSLATIGTMEALSARLTIATPLDFRNGEGIKIEHAGRPCMINGVECPAGPKP